MIIYGVWACHQPADTLMNLFLKAEDAEAYVESRKYPHNFYIQEMQVY